MSKGLEILFEVKKKLDSRKPIVKTIFTITKLNLSNTQKLLDYAVEANIIEIYLSLYIPYLGGLEGISCEGGDCIRELKEQLEKIAIRAINMPIRIWSPNLSSYTSRVSPRRLFVDSCSCF